MLNNIIEKIENKLVYIPITDEEKQNIVNIINCFYTAEHSNSTTDYALNNIVYYLYMNSS